MPKKNTGTFEYPGGKTTIGPWIIEYFPDHNVYVEPFGGSASVLMQKPRSTIEVYNDINSDCVTFFEAIKNHSDELREWVKNTPYSRELYEKWQSRFNDGYRPADIVERVGRFWYLTTASFGSDIHKGGGTFSVNKTEAKDAHYPPIKWNRKGENVEYIRDRFNHVQVENLDYTEVVEKYDGEDTFFYFDPPYVKVGENYYTTNGGFNHQEFVDVLNSLRGHWLVSYGENIPNGLEDYTTVTRTKEATMSKQRPEITEQLIMNYDPNQTPKFRTNNQTGIESFTD